MSYYDTGLTLAFMLGCNAIYCDAVTLKEGRDFPQFIYVIWAIPMGLTTGRLKDFNMLIL